MSRFDPEKVGATGSPCRGCSTLCVGCEDLAPGKMYRELYAHAEAMAEAIEAYDRAANPRQIVDAEDALDAALAAYREGEE